MHDIGRTQLELGESEFGESEYGEAEFGEFSEFGELGELGETNGPLGETAELELAAELLEVSNEQELEQFLGKLLQAVGRGAATIARSPVARAVGTVLKDAALRSLPALGQAVGGSLGRDLGQDVASHLGYRGPEAPPRPGQKRTPGHRRPADRHGRAPRDRYRRELTGHVFGLELEGLSHEDREFEVAKQFVRFASTAAHNALAAGPSAGSPLAAARTAAAAAAAQHAPGLVPMLRPHVGGGAGAGGRGARSGRWVRRGRSIVLIGI